MPTSKQQHWERMYQKPLDAIPWEIAEPPQELVDYVQIHNAGQGKALDIGCGTGNYAQYLAQNGFDVTAIDFSETALAIARQHAKELRLNIEYVNGDITHIRDYVADNSFNFILDYSILHHISPQSIEKYAQDSVALLKPDGQLLLVCYSDADQYANGERKATGTYGNEMYYRSAAQIMENYSMLKVLHYDKARLGKRSQHAAHCFLFEKSHS